MRKLIPATLFGAHFVLHFTIPILDWALHGALLLSVIWSYRSHVSA